MAMTLPEIERRLRELLREVHKVQHKARFGGTLLLGFGSILCLFALIQTGPEWISYVTGVQGLLFIIGTFVLAMWGRSKIESILTECDALADELVKKL